MSVSGDCGTGVDGLVAAQAQQGRAVDVCKHCGKTGADMKTCTGCKLAKYCGPVCQRANWKAGHKKTCIGKAVPGDESTQLDAGQRCEDAEDYDGAEKA